MKQDNPFSLTFGMLPYKVIGRYEEKDRVISTFTADNAVSHVFLIEGIRGSGKTVLMTSISNELCENKDWIGVDLNPAMNLLDNLAENLTNSISIFPDIFDKGFSLSVGGVGIGINGTPKKSSVGITEDILEKLKKKNKKLIITIDEVSNSSDMRLFASQFQIFLRKRYPVFLIMTGLYENIYDIQNDASLTFLLRSPKVHLEALSLMQIARQYEDIFDADAQTAMIMAKETKGYAFAFQAFGMLAWEYGIDEIKNNDSKIFQDYESLLDDFAYRKIWSELTKKEQEIVLAINDEGSTKVAALCAAAGISNSMFSQYRRKLIAKGILASPAYGYVELTLPRFSRIASYYELN